MNTYVIFTDLCNIFLGHYIYLETSGRRKDKYATFGSPTYGQSFSECQVEFWYHMMGRDVGILRVDHVEIGKGEAGVTTLWKVAGNRNKNFVLAPLHLKM